MTWWEVDISPWPTDAVELLSSHLFTLGAQGLQEDYLPGEEPPPRQPWDDGPAAPEPSHKRIVTWFETPSPDELLASLQTWCAPQGATVQIRPVVEEDWTTSWQASFPRLEIAPGLTIAAPWNAESGDLIIEPGQGFGTGQHATTKGILRFLLDGSVQGETALDVGCGSGVLAIAAARLGLKVSGFDIDPEAIHNAVHNAEMNSIEVPFRTATLDDVHEPADIVMANIYAELLHKYADQLVALTGRHLLLAGILADREQLVRKAFDHRLELVERAVDGEWVHLHYRVPA